MKPIYIAQGLLKTWKEQKAVDISVAPLEYYLRFNYEERYVKLCHRLGCTPISFGKWLCKRIDAVI